MSDFMISDATSRSYARGAIGIAHNHARHATTAVCDGERVERIARVPRREALGLRIEGQRVLPLHRRTLRLGTHPTCDLVIDDPAVSPQHCEVVPAEDGWAVWDLGSTNGVWVGGARVPMATLEHGVSMTLGRTRVQCVAIDETPRGSCGIAGSSSQIEYVRREIERLAVAPYAVLIEGESGVGKELVARALHAQSTRRHGPLVAVNCGAIAPELIESELFGHERGAFTGAVGRRRGLFEEANGGTLFLDEVAELSLPLQAKLLRVLETGEIRRVGAEGTVRVDVRVLSATLRDIEQRVCSGAFRNDLFFRLQDFRLRVPALRERPSDIGEIAEALLRRIGHETGHHRRLEDGALARLMAWHWPGNVRELFAALKRAVFVSQGPTIAASHLEIIAGERLNRPMRGVEWPDEVANGDLTALVAWCGGNLSRVSAITGLARSTVRARLARAGAKRADFAADEAG
jgi:DNA-binding NtrC family response regulator